MSSQVDYNAGNPKYTQGHQNFQIDGKIYRHEVCHSVPQPEPETHQKTQKY